MKKILLVVFFCLVIFLLIDLAMKSNQKAKKNSEQNSPKVSIIKQNKGWFKLIPLSDLTVSIGDSITFNLVADSHNFPITGYDLILSYDKNKVNLKELKNQLENFNIYDQRKPGELIVTGVISSPVQTKNIFQNTALIQLTFQTIGIGQAEFKINWEKNSKKESNLISDNNQEILDLVQGATVNIGKKITLIKDQIFKLEDGVELVLIDFTSASQGCFDCISSAKVSVSKNDQKKDFTFKIGGIAGLKDNEFSAFGHGYYLDKINDNGITTIIF